MTKTKVTRRAGKQTKEVSNETKHKITLAAIEVFARDGYDAANLRDIAFLAGTTHGLIRHYFGSKDGLWKAGVDYCTQLHLENLTALNKLKDKLDTVEFFKAHIKAYILFSIKNAGLFSTLMRNDEINSTNLKYIIKKQAVISAITEPLFIKVQERGYFNWFDHNSFFLYLMSLVEMPILGNKLSSILIKADIFSEAGIKIHTENVLNILFQRDAVRRQDS